MPPTEWVAPIASALGVVLVALIVQSFSVWNRRRGNMESKTPTVQQIWDKQVQQETRFDEKLKEISNEAKAAKKEAEASRRDRDTYKTAFVGLRDVFLSFVERAQNGGPFELTVAEHRALELPVTNVEEDDLAAS